MSTREANGRVTEPTFWAAPEVFKAGYKVFPVKGKAPAVEGGFYHQAEDLSEIAAWIEEGREHHDIGVTTGLPGRVVAIDADSPESFAQMEAKYGPPSYTTRRGGHWLFRHPRNGKVSSNRIAPGLDRKGDGGYVVFPPSKGRQWTDGITRVEDLPVLPQEFWSKTKGPTPGERRMPQDRKDTAAACIAEHVRGIGANAAEGGRHDHLRHLCGVLLGRGVSLVDAEDILKAAWGKVGGDLSGRLDSEIPNTLATTQQAIKEERATGVPKMEEITPGLYEELADTLGWIREIKLRGRKTPGEGPTVFKPSRTEWPELNGAALYGLPGDVVRTFEPHTEADPVAVLVNLLCAFGSAAGRGAFARVGTTEHHLKLFVGLIGETAKGRKGESWGPVRRLMEDVDPGWASERVMSGLSSGEGLIYHVRDEVRGERKEEEVVLDPGEPDKRLLAMEGELAGLLKVMSREGNTLSPTIRQAWDGDRLRTMTKNNPTKATGAHISIIGHVTKAELLRHLSDTEAANGFANRFLWLMVRRSKALPFGGDVPQEELKDLSARLDSAIRFGRQVRPIRWGESARAAWAEVYGPLSEGKPGLFGAVVGRAEAQALRLATLYAVMDESATIEHEHLAAALALWSYAEESARYIFGDATGDPVADDITEALRAAGNEGLSRTEIRDLFGRHKSAERINQALGLLLKLGRVDKEQEQTGGRPTERWYAA